MIRKRCWVGSFLIFWTLLGRSYSYDASEYYKAGLQLYNAKDYSQAIRYFGAALSIDPRNVPSLMGRGNCYYAQGQYQEALVDYQSAEAISPSPGLEKMIQYLQGKAAPIVPSPIPTPTHHPSPSKTVRLFGGFEPLNLGDFKENSASRAKETDYFNSSSSGFTYSKSLPDSGFVLGLEGDYTLLPQLEGGIRIAIWPLGTISDEIAKPSANYDLKDSFNIVAGGMAPMARYYFTPGDIQPWIGGGPMLSFGTINYNYSLNRPSGSVSFSGPFTGIGFGAQLELGLDIRVSDKVSVSVFGGYTLASISNFQGTIGTSNIPGVSNGASVQLESVPSSDGNVIVPVTNGVLAIPDPDLSAGSPAPTGSRPISLDLSGPVGGVSVEIYW